MASARNHDGQVPWEQGRLPWDVAAAPQSLLARCFVNVSNVLLFTDGACSGNPGPGGWAYILRHEASGKEKEQSGAEADTTNNRMELMAVIRGLEALKKRCRVQLYTDSVYVGKGLSQWMANWKKNNWRRKDGKRWVEVKNAELWQRLDQLLARHEVQYHRVAGHSGHPENERCDELAVEAYRREFGERR